MYKPRIQAPKREYSAEDAQRVLERLRTDSGSQGVLRYRRSGAAFFVTNERPVPERARVHTDETA